MHCLFKVKEQLSNLLSPFPPFYFPTLSPVDYWRCYRSYYPPPGLYVGGARQICMGPTNILITQTYERGLRIPFLNIAGATSTPQISTQPGLNTVGPWTGSNTIIELACISQSIGTGYLYPRDFVTKSRTSNTSICKAECDNGNFNSWHQQWLTASVIYKTVYSR